CAGGQWGDLTGEAGFSLSAARTMMGPSSREGGAMPSHLDHATGEAIARSKYPTSLYEKELLRLQEELVKMEEWVQATGARIVVVFEGRDAEGKRSVIKRINEHRNQHGTKQVA